MTLYLTIDDVVLSGFEIPEQLDGVGGTQSIVKHEFPGGIITLTPLGAFPHTIKWSGLMSGADAFARAQILDRKRALGDEVILSYGPFSWSGLISDFTAKPKHQFLVPYEITFEPDVDLSGIGAIPLGAISLEAQLGTALGAIGSIVDGDDGLTLPSPLVIGADVLTAAVNAALLDGNGTVAGMSTADSSACIAAAAALGALCLPYSLGTDPTQASPALNLSTQSSIVDFIINSVNAGATQVRTINPNLFNVAAAYLGDATRWAEIATASGLPMDPQPIGEFVLQVPAS
jgi:hypothetical protein